MIRIERATSADFEPVLPLLDHFENPAITREHWRTLFFPPWPCDDDLRGFVLRDGEKAVGFFGAIPSERMIDGRRERFANLTSWITLSEYRNHSIRLFQAVAAIENRTLTCLTPLPSIHPLYKRFGFQDLESKLRILLPAPSPRALRFHATADENKIARLAMGTAREVFEAHRGAACRHLLVHRGERQCLVVFSRRQGRRRHFARVHGITDREFFVEAIESIRWRLMFAARAMLVMIDARWLQGAAPAWSRESGLAQLPVYRSATLRADQIDHLYSELVLLPV
jgi:hypothetical protein